jgi:hypothetical protein
MFRRDIRLRQPQDAVVELARTRAALARSALPEPTRSLLGEQIESTLGQFREQMSSPHVQKILADRVLEGDGYRVTIEVRQGQKSLLSFLLRLLRGG